MPRTNWLKPMVITTLIIQADLEKVDKYWVVVKKQKEELDVIGEQINE